jgi:hypothetical protein
VIHGFITAELLQLLLSILLAELSSIFFGVSHCSSILDSNSYVRGLSKNFGEWYQNRNKTEDTSKLTLLAFKLIAILHSTLLTTFIKFLETVSKGLFRNRTQNRYHKLLDCRHVCKTYAFHDALQAGKQKEVHPPYSPDLAPAGARSGDYGFLIYNYFYYYFILTVYSHGIPSALALLQL